jgi:hypothetical protein
MSKDKIKIRTGSRISAILQSTVTYAQAFTELAKNALQNGASFVDIKLSEGGAVITDDGLGFNHEKDDTGMTGFEKYFVFGNSYDMFDGVGLQLGHMGIGGKIANDKLSDNTDIHWTIETKNKHGKHFLVTYAPKEVEFLDDYEPTVEELKDVSIKTKSGTVITIHNLDTPLVQHGWDLGEIKTSLRNFFGHLARTGETNFDIILNGHSLEFDYALPGYVFSEIVDTFEYEMGGKKTSEVSLNLSLIQNQDEGDACPLDSMIVVSDVKICNLALNREDLVVEIYKRISKDVGRQILPQKAVRSMFSNLRGFVVCKDLSDVLDHTGMPAKDLSHHGLRDDHPITIPFYDKVYSIVIDLIRGYLLLDVKQNTERLDSLAVDVVELIADTMDIGKELLFIDPETQKSTHSFIGYFIGRTKLGYQGYYTGYSACTKGVARSGHRNAKQEFYFKGKLRKGTTLHMSSELEDDDLLIFYDSRNNSVSRWIYRRDDGYAILVENGVVLGFCESDEDPLESQMSDVGVEQGLIDTLIESEVDNKMRDIQIRPKHRENIKRRFMEKLKTNELPEKLKKAGGVLRYEVRPFGKGREMEMSALSIQGDLSIHINSENYKLVALDGEEDTHGLTLHLAELVIYELMRYEDSSVTKDAFDKKLSDFYRTNYTKLRVDNFGLNK